MLGDQIKTLRKERGCSQADLAQALGADAGQISRYENGKTTPSLDAVVRLAEILDVTTDHLLIDGAPRQPFRAAPDPLTTRLADVEQLSDDDKTAILHILDSLLANTRIRAALNTATG